MITARQPQERTKENTGYTDGNRIRGPKVYPHHAHKISKPGFWDDVVAMRENGVLASLDENGLANSSKSNQNRSIRDWVRSGAEFSLELRVTNLSAFELGGLIWLLTLEDGQCLRLGLGKPLGFGNVCVELLSSDLRPGADIVRQWTGGALEEPVPAPEFKRCFEAEAKAELLSAFRVAARGVPNLPVRYPLLPGPPSGKHYEWFLANEQEGGREKSPGLRLSLPDLTATDISLSSSPVETSQ